MKRELLPSSSVRQEEIGSVCKKTLFNQRSKISDSKMKSGHRFESPRKRKITEFFENKLQEEPISKRKIPKLEKKVGRQEKKVLPRFGADPSKGETADTYS